MRCRPASHRAAPAALRALVVAAALLGAAGCGEGSDGQGAPRPGGDPGQAQAVVWAVGDGADGGENARAVVRMMTRGRVDRLLYLGDVYEEGTAEEFERNYHSVYGRLAGRTSPSPGNHEWANHRTGYDPYWRRVTGRPMPSFYAFRIGGWEVLSLNSEAPHHEPGDAQLRWLRARVRGPGTCRIAFWHRPRYSHGRHGDQDDVEPFWQALAGRATLVVNGHDHDMQRFPPIRGITQLIAGAGGHGLYAVDRGDDPRLAFADDTHYGALRLELRPGRARYAFVAADGRTLDAGEVGCRP